MYERVEKVGLKKDQQPYLNYKMKKCLFHFWADLVQDLKNVKALPTSTSFALARPVISVEQQC